MCPLQTDNGYKQNIRGEVRQTLRKNIKKTRIIRHLRRKKMRYASKRKITEQNIARKEMEKEDKRMNE